MKTAEFEGRVAEMLFRQAINPARAAEYSPQQLAKIQLAANRKAKQIARKTRDELHPVAVAGTMGYLGGGALTSLSYAGTGASTGGAVAGPIGAAVGAVIGALVGIFGHTGQKPQRAAEAAAVMQQLTGVPDNFSGRLITWPDMQAVFNALIIQRLILGYDRANPQDHPSSYPWWMDRFKLNAAALVRAVFNNPAGAMVSVPLGGDVKGSARTTFQFTNPGPSADTATIANNVVIPGTMQWQIASNTGAANAITNEFNNPIVRKVYTFLTDKEISEIAPTVSVAPPPVAHAMVPSPSQLAAAVVPPTPAAPANAVAVTAPAPVVAAGAAAAQAAVANGTLPANPTGVDPNAATTALLQQLLAQQGVSQNNQMAQPLAQQVASQGIQNEQPPSPPAVTPVSAGFLDGIPPWALLAGFGALVYFSSKRVR